MLTNDIVNFEQLAPGCAATKADKKLEISDLGRRFFVQCTTYGVKTKALISCAVTAQLICIFVFSGMQIIGFLVQQLICHSMTF